MFADEPVTTKNNPSAEEPAPPSAAAVDDDALDGIVRWIGSERVSVGICLVYGFVGLGIMMARRELPQSYVVLMYFFVSKMVVEYDKCTLSYIECKVLRGVPRERGLLNAIVSTVVAASRRRGFGYVIAAFTALATYYYFVVQGGTIVI